MTILEKSNVAIDYYKQFVGNSVVCGFEKLIATDGTNCIFVDDDYNPENTDIVVFRLSMLNRSCKCEIYNPKHI